jgi:hypothetical protein
MKFLLLVMILSSCALLKEEVPPSKSPREVQEDKTYSCLISLTDKLMGYGERKLNMSNLTNSCLKIYK